MIPALEVFRVETTQMLAVSTIGIVSDPNIDDPGAVLAPELPNLPGLDLPGMNLPGMNLPGMGLPE